MVFFGDFELDFWDLILFWLLWLTSSIFSERCGGVFVAGGLLYLVSWILCRVVLEAVWLRFIGGFLWFDNGLFLSTNFWAYNVPVEGFLLLLINFWLRFFVRFAFSGSTSYFVLLSYSVLPFTESSAFLVWTTSWTITLNCSISTTHFWSSVS